MSLRQLPVLIFDCQTTSTSAERGNLIEVAWTVARAEAFLIEPGSVRIESRLVRLPEGVSVPSEITVMTGIDDSSLEDAPDEASIWHELLSVFSRLGEPRLMVAHYARFELGFLKKIHERLGTDTTFPFETLCTHTLAKKLLPDLPAWGIRALSGYFGGFLPELKHSESHALSTLRIWAHLVDRLGREPGLSSLDDLKLWMAKAAPRRGTKRAFLLPREKRLALSNSPGIYRMRSSDGTLLYIGKATSLKSRVNSYFRASSDRRSQLPELLTQVSEIEVVETATSLEAALLEADEIKTFQPPYNTSLLARTKAGRARRCPLKPLITRSGEFCRA